ncbi:hypothetical protein [Sorangium sp. So ce362]|uniref:hypothetical protein n=1 Tax=Sorangium sp. So ce362 TaxID=3133303 RepID=UPI003F60C323
MMASERTAAASQEDEAPESGKAFVLERARPLSQSALWGLQRRYFHDRGVEAWSSSSVPCYVTTNPALAHAYAEVLFGFLRDCVASRPAPGEPLTIVELGAGSGRFAYLLVRALREIVEQSPLRGLRFRYVLTDFTETNVAFYRAHEALRPLVAQGLVDFAIFDAERDREIRLLEAGETLGPGGLADPLAVVANYVFDGIPQDGFSFKGGRLEEVCVALSLPERAPDPADPALIERLTVGYELRPAPLAYYGDPDLDAILADYAGSVEGAVLFPSAAIGCLRRLAELSRGRVLLLSGDRGGVGLTPSAQLDALGMATHGSFSFPVNYHAVGAYTRRAGGRVLAASHAQPHLAVAVFLLGEHPTAYAETALAYARAFEQGGASDFFALRRGIEDHYGELDLDQLTSLLRLSRWDPRILRDCLAALWGRIEGASEEARREVTRAIHAVWDNYYFIGEEQDLAFELGLLLHALEEHGAAIRMFEASERLWGGDPRARWNIGLCHFATGQIEEALGCFRAAGEWPGFRPAGGVQVKRALP